MSASLKPARSASASGKSSGAAEKEKAALSHFVFTASPDDQVSLLAQALLREYMHKRKFTGTLKTFDEESPRDETTVSSRAVMLNMMHLADSFADIKAESAAIFAAGPSSGGSAVTGGVETIMETLCFLRTQVDAQRRQAGETRAATERFVAEERAIREGELAAALEQETLLQRQLEEIEARTAAAVAQSSSASDSRRSKVSTSMDNAATVIDKKSKKDKKDLKKDSTAAATKKKSKAPTDIDDLFASDDEHTKAAQLASTAAAAAAAASAAPMLNVDDLLVPSSSNAAIKKKKKSGAIAYAGNSDRESSSASSSSSGSDSDSSTPSESPTRGIKRISSTSPSLGGTLNGTYSLTTNGGGGVAGDANDQNESDGDDYAAALRRIRRANELKAVEEFQQQKAGRNLFAEDGGPSSGSAAPPVNAGSQQASAVVAEETEDRATSSTSFPIPPGCIGTKLATAIITAFVGDSGRRLPPSFFQPLDFIDSNSIDLKDKPHMATYGLLQHEGGPCGALAVLQARLLASLYWTDGAAFDGARHTPQAGADALRRAVATTLALIATRERRSTDSLTPVTVSLLVPPSTDNVPLLASHFGSGKAARSATRRQQLHHLTAATMEAQVDTIARCRRVEVTLKPCGVLMDDVAATALFDSSAKRRTSIVYDDNTAAAGGSLNEIMNDAWHRQCPQLALLCFLASALLTHAATSSATSSTTDAALSASLAAGIQADMDEPRALIVEHGYCSQEMVNLLLAGRATSNVHDGTITMGDGGMRLRGFESTQPLDVGYLSFLEVRQLLHVGTRGKRPVTPVWVILHESHYTVLFARRTASDSRLPAPVRDAHLAHAVEVVDGAKAAPMASLPLSALPVSFDLWYYDQQGGMTEEVRLTVALESLPLPARRAGTLVSFVDQVLRTVPLWAEARVNWNGSDPLL